MPKGAPASARTTVEASPPMGRSEYVHRGTSPPKSDAASLALLAVGKDEMLALDAVYIRRLWQMKDLMLMLLIYIQTTFQG